MSGGHFEHSEYHIQCIAEQLEEEMEEHAASYSEDTMALLKKTAKQADALHRRLYLIDRLLSSDCGEESFNIRMAELNKELTPIRSMR
jgi:hypothetical protein